MNLPRISVVTVSYNQATYLEQAIKSVLDQEYPNLEYIVIDGGSTDGSVEIVKRFSPMLHYWVSEQDSGQSDALNKGFARATGDILCWLNSDDLLEPGSLQRVANELDTGEKPSWLIGSSRLIDSEGNEIAIRKVQPVTIGTFNNWSRAWFPQQSTFWNRALWNRVSHIREDLHYSMDMELWLRMWQLTQPIIDTAVFSSYRFHSDAKCFQDNANMGQECRKVLIAYYQNQGDSVLQAENRLREVEKIQDKTKGWRRHFLFKSGRYLESNAVIARARIKMKLKKWLGNTGAQFVQYIYHFVRDISIGIK